MILTGYIIGRDAAPRSNEFVIKRAISRATRGALDELAVLICGDRVLLTGQALTYATKKAAQDVAMAHARGKRIVNQIEVRYDTDAYRHALKYT